MDLSEVKLTHHNLKNRGDQGLALTGKDASKLDPMTEAGSGMVREKESTYLREIIEKVNDLFDGELMENDKLMYLNDVLKG